MKASLLNEKDVLLETTHPGESDLIAALANIRGYEIKVYMKKKWDPAKRKYVKEKVQDLKLYKIVKVSEDLRRAKYPRFLHDPIITTLVYSGLTSIQEAKIPQEPRIEINNKWLNILRDYQKESLEELLKRDNGVAKLYTGAGKLEMALALIESFLEQYPEEHAIVLVPTNSIRDEWAFRMKKWNVNPERISVVNPVGLMRRKSLQDYLSKWKNPGLIVSDEVHHIQAKSWLNFLDVIGRARYSYGFSATPEVDGKDIKENSDLLGTRFPISAYRLAIATGPVRTERFPKERKKEVEIIIFDGRVANERITPDEAHYVHLVETTITSEKITNHLVKHMKEDPDMKLYIPVITKNSGLRLASQYASKGIPTIYWDSNSIRFFVPGDSPRKLETIEDIKDLVERGEARVLITTSLSYEGVDMPSLNAVLLVHGKNDRMILQPLGRSARGGKTKVYIVKDRNNPALVRQANKRIRLIEEQYNVSKKGIILVEG